MPRAGSWTVVLRAALASAVILRLLGTHPVTAQDEDYDPLIVISMGDHFFEVSGMERDTPIKVKAGRVYFVQIRNDGKHEHNVEWGREVLTKDGMPEVYATHLMGHVPVKITHSLWDLTVDGVRDLNMAPGQQVELEVFFPESARGNWEIGCFRPGHYDAGMRLPLIVE